MVDMTRTAKSGLNSLLVKLEDRIIILFDFIMVTTSSQYTVQHGHIRRLTENKL